MKNISRRDALVGIGLTATGLAAGSTHTASASRPGQWWAATPAMDTMTAIRTRRSVRAFLPDDVPDSQLNELLAAAMSAPSAGNEQPWEFVVIREKATLSRIGDINRFARYAASAPLAILACGNMEHDKYGGFWIEDVSAATQNLLLAAHAMNLGAVWTGVYPVESRVQGFRALLGLPEHIVPMALVIAGHPRSRPEPENRFDATRIHKERWQG